MNRVAKVFFWGVFFAFSAACGGNALAAGPEEAVIMVQKGVDSRDLDMVEKYLDLDAVLKKAVEVAVADESVIKEAGKYPAAALVLALGSASGANDAVRDLLAAETREYIRHGVVSGAFAGAPKEDVSVYKGIFGGKAFRGGEKDKKTFGPVSVKQKGDSSARLATSLADAKNGKTYPLDLIVQKQQGIWRIVEIGNAPELVHQTVQKRKK